MARKLTLIDDIDGTIIEEDGGTIRFSVDGTNYEIDLSAKNAAELQETLQPYISAGRKARGAVGTATSSAPSKQKSDPQRLKGIREWAAANGHEVSSRGRVSALIQDAYDAAH